MQWLPCGASIHDSAVATARFGHSAVCISGSGSVWGTDLVVAFGGVSYSDGESALEHHTALADVTVLQAEADMWFAPQVSPATAEGGLPEPRAFHCAAAMDRRMYVFGGHVMSYDAVLNKKRRRFFNDLWCLDTDTWTWQCLSPGPVFSSEGPPRRDMATLTRAGAACLLLFGGRLESGRVAGDAWVLDTSTHTWSQLRMPGPSPPPRKMHAAMFVPSANSGGGSNSSNTPGSASGGRVVLFGGERDAGLLDDLWTLKGVDGSEPSKWTQIKLRPAPSGRFGHAMAACGSRLAVFGGCLDHSSLLSFSRTYVQCNELWVLDLATFSWHRVDPPEGVLAFSGAALEDPALLPLLQQQAAMAQHLDSGRSSSSDGEGGPAGHQQQQPAGTAGAGAGAGSGMQPASPHQPLLPLPLERMCHSLVTVGAEGRLLLVGGRKREGICEDAWWLSMGPDDLTPVLAAPRPEVLAAALHAFNANRPAQSRAQPPVTAATTTVGGSPGAATLAAPPGGAPGPVLPNPTLLANLLRRSAPPATATTAIASTAADSPSGRQHPQQYPPPQLVPEMPGQPAGATAGGSGGISSLHSSSGSALDASSSSVLVPVPASYPGPGPGGGPGSGPGSGTQGMAPSRSTGSINMGQASAGGAAAAAGGGSFSGSGAGVQATGGGRERTADKAASLAFNFNRFTKQVSTLLNKDAAAASPPPPAPAAGSGAGQLSTSPSGGGGGIFARLLDSSGARNGTTVPAAVPPPSPPSYHHRAAAVAGGSRSTSTSPTNPAPPAPAPGPASTRSSSTLAPEMRADWERLRARLGLAPADTPAASDPASISPTRSRSSHTLTGPVQAPAQHPPGSSSPGAVDPAAALAALGLSLAAASAASAAANGAAATATASGDVDAAAAVSLARSHLTTSNPERLTTCQLDLVLADCQSLLKGRAALAWERLELEGPTAADRQQQAAAGSAAASGSGGGGATDRSALSCLVASHSHWLAGVRAEQLRLGDVSRMMMSYGELLAGGMGGK